MESKKILIADDGMDILPIINAILSKEGYTVISANNKAEGMNKIREEKPGLTIPDLMMTSHHEGFKMAKEITDAPELRKLPTPIQSSIDILTKTRADVQAMARESGKYPGFKKPDVLQVSYINMENTRMYYLSENRNSIRFPMNGFVSNPVSGK